MAISESSFDNESELEKWVYGNSPTFFGDCILLKGFRITTPSGKHGIPDGFAFNFAQRSWWIIECELLSHGVWPHIAEQITRFVVASRSTASHRQVRDKLFEAILAQNKQDAVVGALETTTHRLLQQIELFIEGVAPSLALFIDDSNQDLLDFCDALDISAEIYRVKKFMVNGRLEYYSPDRNAPAATFDPEETRQEGSKIFDVVNLLGGGEVVSSKFRCYRLADGRVVKIQYSKLHERRQAYWYGISPHSHEQAKVLGVTDFIFLMGGEGFVPLSVSTVDEFLKTAYATNNPDGTIRHYHMHLSQPPEVLLKGYSNAPDLDVSDSFQTLD